MKSEASGYFKDLLTSRANNLLEHQTVVAAMSYNSRSGELLRSVQQSPSLNGASDAELTLEYPLYIRFLDMKKGRGGRKKKVYEPGTYMALLRGLTGRISMTVVRAIEGEVTDIR